MTQAGDYRSTLDMGVAAADADEWTRPGFVRATVGGHFVLQFRGILGSASAEPFFRHDLRNGSGRRVQRRSSTALLGAVRRACP